MTTNLQKTQTCFYDLNSVTKEKGEQGGPRSHDHDLGGSCNVSLYGKL